MGRAIGLGFVIVMTFAMIRWISPGFHWVDFALLVVAVGGIGAVVAYANRDRPFLTAA